MGRDKRPDLVPTPSAPPPPCARGSSDPTGSPPCGRVMGLGVAARPDPRPRPRARIRSVRELAALGVFLLDGITGRGRRCCHEAMMGAGPGRSSEEANVSHAVCRARALAIRAHACMCVLAWPARPGGLASGRSLSVLPQATGGQARYTARACRSHEATNEWRVRVHAPGSLYVFFFHTCRLSIVGV